MAWNPSPKVAAARDYGRRFGKEQVIIFSLNREIETLEYASYGSTRKLCENAKKLADIAYETLLGSSEREEE